MDYERILSPQNVIILAHQKNNLVLFDDTHPMQLNNRQTINGTVELKANFIRGTQVGGVLVHSIDLDDFTGQSCGQGPFPITSVVSRIFSKPMKTATSTETTPTTSTMDSTPMQTSTSKPKGPCSNVKTTDLIPDEKDYRSYYVCAPNRDEPVAHLRCPNNMHFSPTAKACSQEFFASFASH